ncbi:serine/threonine protein kinase [Planctomycetales bacterium]|nr:serine/threonine protein kinase [Planctomycetales bacterium]
MKHITAFLAALVTLTAMSVFAQNSKLDGGVQPEPEAVDDESTSVNPAQELVGLLERAKELALELEGQQEVETQFNPFADRAADRINESALKLYQKLPAGENVVFSPLSLYQAFSIVYMGAKNETAKQFRNAIDLDLFAPEYNFNSPELQTANAVWLFDEKIQLEESFLDAINEVGEDVFRKIKPDNALDTINGWFNEKTKGRIPKLFDKLDENAKLVIGNAVYFKGQWEEPFEKELTDDRPFYALDGKEQKVPMMHNNLHTWYGKGKDYAAIGLPYKGNRYSMCVILPDKGVDFKKIKEQIEEIITETTGTLRDVELSLPKFEIESTFDLETVLTAAGVTDAFDNEKADFSGMTGEVGLMIGQAIQKANITVNEEGTVAAAATGIEMKVMSAAPEEEPVVFNADRPFIYYIIDNETRLIVFVGDKVK